MISWRWQLPQDVMRFMTSLNQEDRLTLIMAMDAAIESAANVAENGSEDGSRIADDIRGLKAQP